MTSKHPSTIQIGPYEVTVEYRKGDELGEFQGDLQRISLHPDQGEDAKADTLLHEILHALVSAISSILTEPRYVEARALPSAPGSPFWTCSGGIRT